MLKNYKFKDLSLQYELNILVDLLLPHTKIEYNTETTIGEKNKYWTEYKNEIKYINPFHTQKTVSFIILSEQYSLLHQHNIEVKDCEKIEYMIKLYHTNGSDME